MLDPLDPNTTVVTAPAGSGKTTLLVQRYLRHLHHTTVDRIVAITFTRKAAAELKDRVAAALRAVMDPTSADDETRRLYLPHAPGSDRARAALEALPAAPVGTTDHFVLTLLQTHLLDAHLVVGDERLWLDGPLSPGGDSSSAYQAAARFVLESMDAEASCLLEHMSFAEAISAVASLAESGVTEPLHGQHLLAALGQALLAEFVTSPASWSAAPNDVPGELHAEVCGWLAAPEAPAPAALLAWSGLAFTSDPPRFAPEVEDRVRSAMAASLGLPTPGRSLWEEWSNTGWTSSTTVGRADALTDALTSLATRAADRALRDVATSGDLGYELLLEAGTRLCTDAPEALAGAYDVVMVDELQDTNPAQLAFYEALADLRDDMRHFFVGDTRQAIYRFRGADPHGWGQIVANAKAAGTWSELQTNYRSSRGLIDVQKHLAGLLAHRGQGGLGDLASLQPRPDAPEGLLGGAFDQPVTVVRVGYREDPVPHALTAFTRRLRARWDIDPTETAAVLVRSWDKGRACVETLRSMGFQAELAAEKNLLNTRLASDLRTWVSGLTDPWNDIDLAAILKHPSVGLTDAALATLRHQAPLSQIVNPRATLAELPEGDAARLAVVRPILLEARRQIGRQSTADLLEWLASALSWRALIAAGPDGQGLLGIAQLDVLLDLVRQAEADVVDPHAVVDALTASGGDDDVPAVRLSGGPQTIQVTTIFSAKGLEWDHVALLENPAESGNNGVESHTHFTLARPGGAARVMAKVDPSSALQTPTSPVAALCGVIGGKEARQEAERLFYVAFTRAKKSVTLGLKVSSKGASGLLGLLDEALVASEHPMVGVFDSTIGDDIPPATRLRARTGRIQDSIASWAEPEGWEVSRPSDRRDPEAAARYRAHGTVVASASPAPLPPPSLDSVPEIVIGDVVHGWLEQWAFAGAPSEDAAAAWLASAWATEDREVATWLVALGLHLRDALPGLSDLLAHATLHFEWPIVGTVDGVVFAGRADLVVELPERRLIILDFKAGTRIATAEEIPGLSSYAGQLEAYRKLFEAAGYAVVETGLVYVRGPSWARFPCGACS